MSSSDRKDLSKKIIVCLTRYVCGRKIHNRILEKRAGYERKIVSFYVGEKWSR